MKYVELNTFLNINGLATSGGNAKVIIRSEKVKVNGEVETRNKRKLHASDEVEYENKKYLVSEDVCLKS